LVYYYARLEEKGWGYTRKPIQAVKDRIAYLDLKEISKIIGNVATEMWPP
jgi:hypothetical protein